MLFPHIHLPPALTLLLVSALQLLRGFNIWHLYVKSRFSALRFYFLNWKINHSSPSSLLFDFRKSPDAHCFNPKGRENQCWKGVLQPLLYLPTAWQVLSLNQRHSSSIIFRTRSFTPLPLRIQVNQQTRAEQIRSTIIAESALETQP